MKITDTVREKIDSAKKIIEHKTKCYNELLNHLEYLHKKYGEFTTKWVIRQLLGHPDEEMMTDEEAVINDLANYEIKMLKK